MLWPEEYEGLREAARWEAYGNESELAVYPDCIHEFTGFPMELAKRANLRIDAFLRRCLGIAEEREARTPERA